jgi:hypothetical protein
MICHIIKLIVLLLRKISSFLWSIKDDLVLGTPGVYTLSLVSVVIFCIGQTGCPVNVRVKDYHQQSWLVPWWRTASAWGTTSSSIAPAFTPPNLNMDCITREVIEI